MKNTSIPTLWKGLILLFMIVISGLFASVIAQDSRLNIQRFGIKDGLSNENITAFYQDQKGFIWLGTSFGINRYDGNAMTSFTSDNSTLCHNYILAISEDDLGYIWFMCGDFGRNDRCYTILNPEGDQFLSLEEYFGDSIPFNPKNTDLHPFHKGSFLLREAKAGTYVYYEVKNRSIQPISKLAKQSGKMRRALGREFAFKLDESRVATMISYNEKDFWWDKLSRISILHKEEGSIENFPKEKVPGYIHSDGEHLF
ncbi:MAG: two-component regulator propeller domain-containing protein, partial [Bacteroidia bacterium]